jgi:homoserine O-acetyltransferase|tara:strand:+ start:186 stop:596 length:411 start_codon:yes stop_codon:yes gene_type:complete
MTTYRSPEEFENRFDVNPTYFNQEKAACFEVESYLEARGRAFSRCFDTDGFLRLSESIDLHCSNPSAIKTPSTLVSFDTDALVPPWLVEDLASQLPSSSEHIRISSIYGHDAFLKESRQVSDVIRLALASPKEVLQ